MKKYIASMFVAVIISSVAFSQQKPSIDPVDIPKTLIEQFLRDKPVNTWFDLPKTEQILLLNWTNDTSVICMYHGTMHLLKINAATKEYKLYIVYVDK